MSICLVFQLFEAVWCLSNIASGDPKQTCVVVASFASSHPSSCMYGALLGCYEFLGSCTDDYGFWRNSCSVGVVSGSSNWTRVCGFHAWGLGVIMHEELLACVVSMFEGRCQLEFWCCGG